MREERSKNPLALMEQVLMVLVFALAAAICVRAFVLARNMSIQSVERDHAAAICQGTAEIMKSVHGDLKAVEAELEAEEQNGMLEVYYDEEFSVTLEEKSVYTLQIKWEESEAPCREATVAVVATAKGKTIFEIKIAWQEVAENE